MALGRLIISENKKITVSTIAPTAGANTLIMSDGFIKRKLR